MKRKFTTLLALVLFISFNAHSQDFYYSPEGKTFLQISTQKILVQFKPGTNFTEQQQILANHKEIKSFTRDMMLPAPEITLLDLENVSSGIDVYTLLQEIASHPKVDYANHFLAHKDGTLHGVMDRVLVRLKNEGQYSFFENEMKKNVYVLNHERSNFDPLLMFVRVVGNKNALEVANELHETQNYAYAEPDFLRLMKRMNTSDPNVGDQWSLENDGVNTNAYGGIAGADMKVFDAWGTTTGTSTIKVAILDEGVDLTHPDLIGNMLAGYDATDQNSAGNPSGDDAHGTACAGIVAAVGNNNTGGAGVAYDSKIIPIRIAYSNAQGNWVTSNAWIGDALTWAVNNADADILSNSWGGGSSSATINNAIDNAVNNGRGGLGSPVLFAAGNDNGDNSYPATYEPTISVIAMSMCNERKNPSSCDGETWWGSNFDNGADLAAPGVKIFATDISGSAGYSSGDYVTNFNGTSSATPNAAGVMALILSANESLTEDQARAAIESTTDKVGGYSYSNTGGQPNGTWSIDLGYGRINAAAAVASVSSSTANDAGINSVTSPTGSICATSDSPVVVLRNYGSNTLTSVNINYSLDGSNSTYNWSGSLAQNATTNVTLPSVSFGSGNHTFDASTSSPNGQADENAANDGASSSFSSGSNNVTLSITFDNYPEETSWDIKDSGGGTVALGGTYGSQADGSTLVIPLCLADACFDFTIYDAYGDGICCGYGNGSYTLTEDASGTVLANGGSFASSETTNFCVPVNVDPPVYVSISGRTDVSCYGGSDGSATAAGTGGNGSITYSWSNGNTGVTASNLSAGNYTVTATSGTATSSVSVTITEPTAVSVSVVGTNATGGNDNGSATATGSGGTPEYSYFWSNNLGTSSTVSGLAAGTYIVTATDSEGCTGEESVAITQSGTDPVFVNISSSTNVSCSGGNDGSATAAATGGNGSYGYSWSNSASGATASGLAAGTYNVTVTSGTATSSVSVIITEPSALGGSVTGTNPTSGNLDGSATASPTGGTTPYTYLWDNSSNSTTAIINGLGAGTYAVTVTDGNNCQVFGSITLVEEPGGGCTYQTIDANGFESGWGIWNDGGSDARRSANDNQYATAGTYCVRLRDNTSTSTMTTDNLNLTSYDEVTVDFGYYPRSMDNSNEDFWLQVSTNGGASYTTVEEWNRGDEFENNNFYTDAVVIPGPFTSTTRFRFRADASGNSDWIYIDEVVISGCTTSPSGNGGPGNNYDPEVLVDKDIEEINEVEKTIQELNLFPNPTNNILNVAFELTNNSDVKMVVMSLTGQMVEMRDLKLEEGTQQFKVCLLYTSDAADE